MKLDTLSIEQARALALHAQGLAARPAEPPSRQLVLETIHRMGCLQIDSINVVARSPYLVLWSRLGDYQPAWLDELLYPEGALFEYWAHAACFIPIEHYRLFRPRMLAHARGEAGHWWSAWMAEHGAVAEGVLAEIRRRGPLGAAAFEAPDDHAGGGWWNWKPAKKALDMLWTMGELMILRRVNFQRIYELRERVLPGWSDAALPDEPQRRRELSLIALRALGLATAPQLGDYFRLGLKGMAPLLEQLAAEGLAQRVAVEGWERPAYVHHAYLPALERGLPAPTLTTLLSPFDPLVWHRERASALFGFDYRIECYTPAPKRRYGYFSLPILRRGRLIGRLDAKAERQAGIFRVKSLHMEPGIELDEAIRADLDQALRECAAWHATPEVAFSV